MSRLLKARAGWTAAVFLAGMLVAAGWALVATEWTDGLDIVPWAGIVGLLAGSLLGWSVFGATVSHAFGAVYGLAWVGLLLSRQLAEQLTGKERIVELVGRLVDWVRLAVSGGTGDDALIFVMLLSGLFWILGYNAGWYTYRRLHVWRAVIPIGVAAMVIVYYYIGSAPLLGYVALYLLFCLLYIARSHLAEQEETWVRDGISYDSDVRPSVLRAGAVVTAIVLSLAWVAPDAAAVPRMLASWREFSKPMRVVQDEWKRLFSTLYGGPPPRVVEPFGSSMVLGGARLLEDTLVMDVEAPLGNRYYWRGAVYSRYDENRWTALERERVQILPGRQSADMESYELREPITQTVTRYLPGQRTLVGASQLRAVDLDAEGMIDTTPDTPIEYGRVLSIVPLDAGEQYSVVSEVSVVDKTALRDAGTDYPEWVALRYLQLPPSLPERVRELAEVITADAETPYEKVVALEGYLRRNVTYDLEPPTVPEGRDYVDYLLFDSQEDYCNGYASAMVVMARSVGIPARIAVGYAQGEYDSEHHAFRVRKEDAHSWPEVYFPRYGWIEFEPTASQSPIIRPEQPLAAESPIDDRFTRWLEEEGLLGNSAIDQNAGAFLAAEQEIGAVATRRALPLWIAPAILGLLAVAAAGYWAVENVGFGRMSPVERSYARLLRIGSWVGQPPRVADTPSEWARAVSIAAPEAREPIRKIADLYIRARFARGDPAAPEAALAWHQARPALWRTWLRRIVPRGLRRLV